jgi:hypothetical protein
MRKEFELTDEQLAKLLEASRPTPVMFLSGGIPMSNSPQENANDAWETLGRELGFRHLTVEPIHGKGRKFFTAEQVAPESRPHRT